MYYRYQAVDGDILSKGSYISSQARSLRNAKSLERFVITSPKNKAKINNFPTRYVKTIPDSLGLFEYGVGQIMYGNKVAIVDYNNQTAVVIESDSVSAFQKSIFKALFHYI